MGKNKIPEGAGFLPGMEEVDIEAIAPSMETKPVQPIIDSETLKKRRKEKMERWGDKGSPL